MPTTTQSVTGVRYLWADNRIVDILRMDYNPNQPRDSRGRFASGGGGGGGSSGGGKKGGGGSGLTSMKASELQKIAADEGIAIDTLSHKRRKSVLAAAIEAKRKGKDLREEGLLKAQKPQSSLAKKRSQSKGKGKKEESISDRVKQVKTANKKPSQSQKTEMLSTQDIINSKTAPPKPKPLGQKERQELDRYNNELTRITDTGGSGQISQKDLQALKKMGIAESEASIWIRTESLLNASNPDKIKQAVQGDALNYANGNQSGRYKELYNRTISDKLSVLGNKDLAEVTSKFYPGGLKAGEPLKASKIKNAPPVLAGELRRRKMLDIDTKGEYKGKRFLPTEWGKLSDKDFTFN